jgi:hypothetical protein
VLEPSLNPLHGDAVADWRLGPEAAPLWRRMYWDAHPAELILPASLALLGAVAVAVQASWRGLGWSPAQYALACFLALNLGFAVAVGTAPLKRWFHHRGDIRGRELATVLADAGAQILAFDWLFCEGEVFGLSFGYALALFAYLALAGLAVAFSPLYLRRAVSGASFLLGAIAALYLLPPVPGMEWFGLVVLYKYLVGHLPREEAYRPGSSSPHSSRSVSP